MKKKGNRYYICLQRLAENAFAAAKHMEQVCSGQACDPAGIQANISNAAHTRTQMLENLSQEFLPPIEREDIARLAFALTRIMQRCNELSYLAARQKAALFGEMTKGAANGYYYVKTVFDAVKCIDDYGSSGAQQCLVQADALSARCAELLTAMREASLLPSGDTKKLLASVAYCDRCGSLYEQCDLTAELITVIILKNG